MERLKELRERCAPNLRPALHSWQFWVAEVVGALAVSTAAGVIYGPWAAFFASVLSLVGIAGLVAVADVFPGERSPKRFALLGGGFCLILAAGMAAAYSVGKSTVPPPPPSVVLETPSGPRPDIRLQVERAALDLDKTKFYLGVRNYGDRVAPQGRVFFSPDAPRARIAAWSFADLAPNEVETARYGLWAHIDGRLRSVRGWARGDGYFSFAVFACYVFEQEDYFTSAYRFTCSQQKQTCSYQILGWRPGLGGLGGCLEIDAMDVVHAFGVESDASIGGDDE